MAKNYNQFSCIGRMTRDAETKQISEHTVAEFSVAVNGRKDTDVLFMECAVWNKQAEVLTQYAKKGSKLFITGDLKQDRWEKDGVKHSKIVCNVSSFEFLDGKPKEDGADKVKKGFEENPFSDDDLPPF